MKKIGYLFMLLVTIVACSSDDNDNTVGSKLQTLKLEGSAHSVLTGDEVVFSLMDEAGNVTEGDLKANNKAISNKVSFNQPGNYTVFGTKKGFRDSNSIEINVVDRDNAELMLQATRKRIAIGEQVSFTVTNNGEKVKKSEGVKVYDVTADKELDGLSFTATSEGDFEFIAKGGVYTESERILISVVKEIETKLIINGQEFEMNYVNMEVKILKADVNDDSGIKKATVVEMEEGVYGNEFMLAINTKDNPAAKRGYIFIDFYVENPTIKVDANGNVIDYGQRVLPSKKTKVVLKSVYSSIEGFKVMESSSKLGESNLNFVTVDYGTEEVLNNTFEGELGMEFGYKSTKQEFNLVLDYSGESLFKLRE